MERKVSFVESEYYHLYNRGVEKRVLFITEKDYQRFMMLLYLANDQQNTHVSNVLKTTKYPDIFTHEREDPLVAIGAFCLMSNHFHILATPLVENGIPRFMHKLQTGYSMYFNTKNERHGSLFQGPYKSTHADDDQYLKYLFSYIHLNPAKLKEPQRKENVHRGNDLMSFVEKYPYSSYHEYIHASPVITNPAKFPEYFLSKDDVTSHIADWLQTEDNYQG